GSEVARGKIKRIDVGAALALPGVLQVFTHENTPRLARSDKSWGDEVAPPGSPFRPLHDDEIRFSAQPVALVVADSLEVARHAASLAGSEYQREAHATNLEERRRKARVPKKKPGMGESAKSRGNADKAFARAAVQIDSEYRVPVEHHNPMEPFATTVVREED